MLKSPSRWWLLLLAALAAVGFAADKPVPSQAAVMIEIRDAIGPATSDFFVRSLDEAKTRGAPLFIVQLDTPGGLDSAMRDMIKAIIASPVPVVIYVAPSGARAASAGTYLLYASHVAAMAPATNLGAATPVQIGTSPTPSAPDRKPDAKEDDSGEQTSGSEAGTAMERKAINDSIAYIRGLAELRGRNAEWAESAVRTAASLPARAALEQNVIDVVAEDVDDLLRQIDGRTVKVSTGEVRLATQSLAVERIEVDWRTQLLAVLTNPNVAYLLMLIGVYGLLLEGYNPGAILPGVIGGICLLLALYAFQVLSVNYAGLALILLGVALIVAEAFTPSFGALGLGGVIAFVIGSIILMDTDVPGFQVATSLIGGIAAAAAIVMLVMASYFARSRRRPVATGAEQLLTERVVALSDFEREGLVRLHGEIWQAVASAPVKEGQVLRVTGVDGLVLHVAPLGQSGAQ
jgi:membrane-bound serine protease (ClpP class)